MGGLGYLAERDLEDRGEDVLLVAEPECVQGLDDLAIRLVVRQDVVDDCLEDQGSVEVGQAATVSCV